MYGPPPECKKRFVRRSTVCVNVSGLSVEIVLRATMMIRACRS